MSMTTLLPDITKIDFLDAEEVEGCAALIISMARSEGLFTTAAHTPAVREIVHRAGEWIIGVEKNINRMTDGDRLRVIDGFDLVHRISFSRPAPTDFINKHILAAFDACMHGDNSVDKYLLFRQIDHALTSRHDKAYFDKPLMWHSMTLNEWVSLAQTGVLARQPLNHQVQIVTAMLKSDLFAFINDQISFKTHLTGRLLPQLTDLDTLDTKTLIALVSLSIALISLGLDTEFPGSDSPRLSNVLAQRSDLHPLRRQAFAIDLEHTMA